MNVTAGMAGTPRSEFHNGVHDGQNRGGKPDGFCQKEARMFFREGKIPALLCVGLFMEMPGRFRKNHANGGAGGAARPVLPDVRRMSDCKNGAVREPPCRFRKAEPSPSHLMLASGSTGLLSAAF